MRSGPRAAPAAAAGSGIVVIAHTTCWARAEKTQAPFVRLADRYALWFLPLTLAANIRLAV
jgi:hypothetical protein